MFLRIGPSRIFCNCTLCSQQSCFNILTIGLKNIERSYLLIQNPFYLIGHHGMWARVIGEILAASTHVPNRVPQTGALKSNSPERGFETKKKFYGQLSVGNAVYDGLPEGPPCPLKSLRSSIIKYLLSLYNPAFPTPSLRRISNDNDSGESNVPERHFGECC